jgi:hypothetical protein
MVIMYINKAVKRLGWRFQQAAQANNRVLKLNQNDIDALQSISDYVEKTQRLQFQDNELFAKMYILFYMRILEKDRTTVFETFARRKLFNFLKQPISSMIEKFTDFLNDQEIRNLFEELNIKTVHPAMITENEKSDNLDKVLNALKTPYNFQRFTRDIWDYETVKNCLELEVNQAINNMDVFVKKR